MIPELGSYAANILAAWSIGLAVLVAIVAISIREARRTRCLLRKISDEARHD